MDTRNTTPLLRGLERQAVNDAKGLNEHFNLSDQVVITSNHIATLGGIRNDLILIYEAEIYFALKDFASVQRILSVLAKDCEDPNFFILSSKISFRSYRFQDTLQYCQAFNERRPNLSPANYQLMGDCYTKLGKSGKAIKCYRKAEEIAAIQGNRRVDLTDKINKQEMIAEFKKEERDATFCISFSSRDYFFLPHPHPRLSSVSSAVLQQVFPLNLATGKDIVRNRSQGLSLPIAGVHSLSGTL